MGGGGSDTCRRDQNHDRDDPQQEGDFNGISNHSKQNSMRNSYKTGINCSYLRNRRNR